MSPEKTDVATRVEEMGEDVVTEVVVVVLVK